MEWLPGAKDGRKVLTSKPTRELFGVMELFCILVVGQLHGILYVLVKLTELYTWVDFIVCKLYLIKENRSSPPLCFGKTPSGHQDFLHTNSVLILPGLLTRKIPLLTGQATTPRGSSKHA